MQAADIWPRDLVVERHSEFKFKEGLNLKNKRWRSPKSDCNDFWHPRGFVYRSEAPRLPELYFMNRFVKGVFQKAGSHFEGEGLDFTSLSSQIFIRGPCGSGYKPYLEAGRVTFV